ncbi:MAG: hypothetical protein R3B09_25835 [Nannocystaceae bacterium]
MDSSSSRSLFFLLSLGTIPLACTDGSGESESETSSGTTSASTTMGTTEGTATAGTATAGTATDGTTTDGTTTDGTATGTATSTTTSETSTTGVPGGLCEDYAAKQVECDPRNSYDEALAYCTDDLAKYAEISPECLAAAEDYYTCEASAACNSDNACDQQVGYLFLACLPEPSRQCTAWATKYVECNMYRPDMIPMVASYCQLNIDGSTREYGEACGTALEEFYACLAALDCAEFDGDNPCPTENAAVEAQCQ